MPEEYYHHLSHLESLAQKIDWLFNNFRNPATGDLFTYDQVIEVIQRYNPDLSGTSKANIHKVRTELNKNPNVWLVEALAHVFQVPVHWLISHDPASEDYRNEQRLVYLRALESSGKLHFATRMYELGDEAFEVISRMVEIALREDLLHREKLAREAAQRQKDLEGLPSKEE